MSRTSSPAIPKLNTTKATASPTQSRPGTAQSSSSTSTNSSSTPLPDLATLLNLPLKITLTANASIPSRTLEGSLYTYDPSTSFVVLSSPSTSTTPSTSTPPWSTKRNYHFLKSSQIQSVTVLSSTPDSHLPSPNSPLPSGPSSSPQSISQRVQSSVTSLRKERSRLGGPGVSEEGQQVFDSMSKTLPVRWNGKEIVVLDEVVVDTVSWKVRGAKGSGERIERVNKVLEGIRLRLASGTSTPKLA